MTDTTTTATDARLETDLYVVINESGDITADTDEGVAAERMDEEYGGTNRRVMKLTLVFAPPKPLEATVELPDQTGEVAVTVKE